MVERRKTIVSRKHQLPPFVSLFHSLSRPHLAQIAAAAAIAATLLSSAPLRAQSSSSSQSNSSSSSTKKETVQDNDSRSQPSPRRPPVEAGGSAITLETSEPLFDVAVALNECGYDADLEHSDPVRTKIRNDVAHRIDRHARGEREP